MRRRYFLFGLAVSSALAIGGCGQSVPEESLASSTQRAVSAGSGVATLSIQSDWSTGYCAEVTIANQGTAPITAWTVAIQIPNAAVANLWSAEYTVAGGVLTVNGLSGSSVIPGGGSTNFGWCSTTTSATDHTPVLLSLDVEGGDVGGSGGAPGTGGGPASGGTSADGGSSVSGGSSAIGGTTTAGGSGGGGTTSAGVAVLDVNSDWKAGYCTNITLTNNGASASTDWTLVLNVPQANISSLWNGAFTRNGDTVTVKPVSSDAVINPGQSTAIGYCATTTGTSYKPSVISFVLVTSPPTGTGGAPPTGGAPTGGTPPTGGSPTGGMPPTGGAPTGGTPPTGGSPTGGTPATGGKSTTGGSPTGGTPATGGARTGGTSATGGRTATGGASGSGGTSSQGSVTASLKVTSDWTSGYCANVDVINKSTRQVTNWTVNVNFPSAQLTNSWSGTATVKNAILSVVPVSYNQVIAPGSSVGFGFCANATGPNHTPTIASVSSSF